MSDLSFGLLGEIYFSFLSYLGPVDGTLQDAAEVERLKWVALAFEELVLEFNPVETKGVKEAFEQVHQHENTKGDGPKNRPKYDCFDYC